MRKEGDGTRTRHLRRDRPAFDGSASPSQNTSSGSQRSSAESGFGAYFFILLFDNPNEAEARAGIYQYDAALGQPEAIYSQANLVIYATQRLVRPVDHRVQAALTRLSRA